MKLSLAIVNNDDTRNWVDWLNRREFSATVTNTSGDFLRVGNTTIRCGVEDARVDELIGIVRERCPTRVQTICHATVAGFGTTRGQYPDPGGQLGAVAPRSLS